MGAGGGQLRARQVWHMWKPTADLARAERGFILVRSTDPPTDTGSPDLGEKPHGFHIVVGNQTLGLNKKGP